ncbi:MAG: TlpA family protein disulfide reductase [Tenacibaculum sp.]
MKSTIYIFLLFSTLFVTGQSTLHIKTSKDLIGNKTPEFSGKTLSNKEWNYNTIKGKVVLVNFWFIKCMPCMKEVKYLNELKEKYKDENFILISIARNTKQELINFNSDFETIESTIRKEFAKEKIKYEIIPECKKSKLNCNKISSLFNVTRYPTTFIINKKGIIEYVKTGFGDKESNETSKYNPGYEKIIDKLLILN